MNSRSASWLVLLLTSACMQQSRSVYPRILAEVPSEFRGSWDEIVEDGCAEREPRFHLGAKHLSNFEIAYEVVKVVQKSPVNVAVHARLDPEFGGPADEVWHFMLVQNGQALSAPDGRPPFFKRCRPTYD